MEDAARDGVRVLNRALRRFFWAQAGEQLVLSGNGQAAYSGQQHYRSWQKGVGHDWAYLPDAGETFAQLMDREPELQDFARFHFRGFWDADGTEMIAAIRRVVNKPSLPVRSLAWFIFRVASPFSEKMRELYANPSTLANSNRVGQREAGSVPGEGAQHAD